MERTQLGAVSIAQVLAFVRYVTLSKSYLLAEPQCLHLSNGDNTDCLPGMRAARIHWDDAHPDVPSQAHNGNRN